MSDFAGRVAVVTGAGKGIRRAYALYLVARGARVVVNDRRHSGETGLASADAVVAEIVALGGQASADYSSAYLSRTATAKL